MKNIILVLWVFSSSYCNVTNMDLQKSSSSEVKQLIIGKWSLVSDKEFIIDIKENSITYYYNGQVEEQNSIIFSFKDSLSDYRIKDNVFDFMRNGRLHSRVEIKEYVYQTKDTVINTIVYIDEKGMDLIARDRSISFNKIQ